MSYQVLVDDNYHFMDEGSRYCSGWFETAEEAVAHCREVVDEYLAGALENQPALTADGLLDSYKAFGDDPFVVATDDSPRVHFSAWDYAEARCAVLRPVAAADQASAVQPGRQEGSRPV